ncbi:MAG: hypothetical protein C0411_20675 [Pseudomonas sp.]|nr:hypothetical protein [Pseudomonas sp.]
MTGKRRRGCGTVFTDTPPNQCGSEPARDDGITFNRSVDCQTAIASRLAPTGDLRCLIYLGYSARTISCHAIPPWSEADGLM